MRKLRTLLIVLLFFSFATRVNAQVPASHSPSAPQRIPTPAATTSPDKSAISLTELAQKPEIVTRLEIFLDQHSFSPGKIDGHWGDSCVEALQRYELAYGQQMANQLDPAIQRGLSQISRTPAMLGIRRATLRAWLDGGDSPEKIALSRLGGFLRRVGYL